MRQFLKANGVRHLTAAPYHPATNGLAERAVQTCKAALKKMSSGTLETKIQRFLFNYRIMPQGTTGLPPAQLLMCRQLRSRLDLVAPNVAKQVQHAQVTQKEHRDAHSKARQFIIGDHILARNYAGSPQWLPGCVTSRLPWRMVEGGEDTETSCSYLKLLEQRTVLTMILIWTLTCHKKLRMQLNHHLTVWIVVYQKQSQWFDDLPGSETLQTD